ncbi:hypothetical protein PV327_000166 [Microctonus hyperodae]|uniref:Uncharacterized protein n=1 Tax=Microctonus hyperodae TaxID=165561 RepID=A0AA39L217_MICHY|nr:hypothetical protein PV327_000166 [Microctonus hyperodae]
MAINLLKSCSMIKANIFCCTRLTSSVKYFQTPKSPLSTLRYNNPISKSKLLTFKIQSISSIITPVRYVKQDAYSEINTNVANNVLLWKYEIDKHFRRLQIFSCVQFSILTLFSYIMYSNLPSFNNYETVKDYVQDNSIIMLSSVMSLVTGICASLLIWAFTIRSLKYIILNKGGKFATLVSFHPIKKPQPHVVLIDDIIVTKGRRDVGQYLSLKLQQSSSPIFSQIPIEVCTG